MTEGKLIVIEGLDGSGRTTQSALLKEYYQDLGYPVKEVGLKRSSLVSKPLQELMEKNALTARTMALLYAVDFQEQYENIVLPSLDAGFIVIADRYIYTLIARGTVRGLDFTWMKNLFATVRKPDQAFFLDCPPEQLAKRQLLKNQELSFWESGHDIGATNDRYHDFINYQTNLRSHFNVFLPELKVIDAAGGVDETFGGIR